MTLESINENLYKFQISNCINKVTISRINQATGVTENVEVPCGKCVHCKNTHINEWFTRMSLHSEYYPYVYFITFTYASPSSASSVGCDYYVCNGVVQRLCVGPQYEAALKHMHRISGTHFTFNAYNSNRVRKAFPALLNQSHMQKAIKILRKTITNGAKISYYYVGEYGHRFGHPHYHMILWSDKHIPNLYNRARRAWSRAYCFKDVPTDVVPYRGQKNVHVFRCPFGHVDCVDLVASGAFEKSDSTSSAKSVFAYVCKYLHKDDYNTLQVDAYYSKLQTQIPQTNDEFLQKDFEDDLYTLTEFRKKFAPYARCSNRCPIGRDYALEHIHEFIAHNTKIPADKQGKPRVFPSYFRKLAKRELFPYFRAETAHGTHSLSYGHMLGIIQNLDLLCNRSIPISSDIFDENTTGRPYMVANEIGLPLLSFYDTKNGYHYRCRCYEDCGFLRCRFVIEKFNRSSRCFDCLGFLSCTDFLAAYKDSYHKLMQYNEYFVSQQLYNKHTLDEFKRRVTASGHNYAALVADSYNVFNTDYDSHQRLYHLKHISLES